MPTTDGVKVGPGGSIEAFTMVYEKFNHLPDRRAMAERLNIGTRVKAVFTFELAG